MAKRHFSFDDNQGTSSLDKDHRQKKHTNIVYGEQKKKSIPRQVEKAPHESTTSKRKFKLKKWQLALIIVFIVLILFLGLMWWMARETGPVYGDRCEGLIQLDQSVLTKTINQEKQKYRSISSLKIETQCKKIQYDIVFNKGTSSATAKKIAIDVASVLDKNAQQSSYSGSEYSVLYNTYNKVRQFECDFYMTCDGNKDFPIYGTKMANQDAFSFTEASITDQSTYKDVTRK